MLMRKNALNLGIEKVAAVLLTGILTSGIFISPLMAQTAAAPETPSAGSVARHYHPDPFAGRAGRYYSLVWGVDALTVKAVEAGELIRFSFEVLDPAKATTLNDKKLEPKLIAPDAKAVLVIPSLEKVGQLRQSSTPEAGKSYWMAFSNPRRTVKRGDRVNVVIGQFHAEGLVVE
jgi:hypothetical protein